MNGNNFRNHAVNAFNNIYTHLLLFFIINKIFINIKHWIIYFFTRWILFIYHIAKKAILKISIIDMTMNVAIPSLLFSNKIQNKSFINRELARSCRFDLVIKSYPRARFNSAKLGWSIRIKQRPEFIAT